MNEIKFFFTDDQPNSGALEKANALCGNAELLFNNLSERAFEITETEGVDLSCNEVYSHYIVSQALYVFYSHEQVEEELPIKQDMYEGDAIDKLKEMNPETLKNTLRSAILGYRTATANLVVGIKQYLDILEKEVLPEVAPPRTNAYEVIEMLASEENNLVLNHGDIPRAQIENAINNLRIQTNDAWTQMYPHRKHKELAKQYLTGKISEKELKQAVENLPEAKFKF